jgi:hypothetical protein
VEAAQVHLHGREQAHRDVDVVRDTGEVFVELVFIAWIERVRLAEQQTRSADRRAAASDLDELVAGVEGAVHEKMLAAPRLVDADLQEPRVFLGGRAAFRDHQRAPEAELDVAAHVMADRALVQAPEILREARHDDVADTTPVLGGPLLCFRTRILHRTSGERPKEYCLTKWGVSTTGAAAVL